jgi:hypothetical protein
METPGIAQEQAGLFTREQAEAAGWSKGALDRALARGTVLPLACGVYTEAAALIEISRRERHLREARATILSLGDQWRAARRTAAVLHGLPLLGRAPAAAQLTRPRTTSLVRSSSRHRHINGLLDHETVVLNGLPSTSLARTVFDIARRESFRSGVVVADAALRAGMPLDELRAVLEDHRSWPGARRARTVVAFADGRAESPLESLGRVVCLEEGLPVFEPQVEVWQDGELVARVDGLWRDALVVFEGDGAMKFTDSGVLPALLDRNERLRDTGLDVVRAGWGDVTRRRERFAGRVADRLSSGETRRLASGVVLVSTRVRPHPLSLEDHYRWPPLAPVYATPQAWALGESPWRGVA